MNGHDPHSLPGSIDGYIAHLQGKGFGGNIVKDRNDQLSPPEAVLWTGKRYQLALLRSGNDAWLELRAFGAPGTAREKCRDVISKELNAARFSDFVLGFVSKDGA